MGSFILKPAIEENVAEPKGYARVGIATLRHNVRWFVNVRWLIIGILALCAAAAALLPEWVSEIGLIPPRVWPWIVVAALTIANIGFWILSRSLSEDSSPKLVELNMWAQIVIDLLAVTVLVHFVGSTDTFIPFIYLLHIVCACIFFTPKRSFLVVLLAAALYALCVFLEHHNVLNDRTILHPSNQQANPHPWLSPLFASSAIALWFGVWYLVENLAKAVAERDRKLEKANKRLRLADEEKNKLVLRTTHDLKAPFSGIESNIQILKLQCEDELSDKAKEILARIERRSHSLSERIRDILLLGQIRSGDAPVIATTTVDIANIIKEVVSELEDKAKSQGIQFKLDLLSTNITGNARHYSILFLNLISNAVTYSNDNGTVTITMRNTDTDCHVSIQDEGIGIEENALPHIFEEYYRTSDAAAHNSRSTGLGLSIVQELAQREGLAIRVTSEKGHGTEFDVSIPGDYCSFRKKKV